MTRLEGAERTATPNSMLVCRRCPYPFHPVDPVKPTLRMTANGGPWVVVANAVKLDSVESRGSITDPRTAGNGAEQKLTLRIGCFRLCSIPLKKSGLE
jgi:hypothetical protein